MDFLLTFFGLIVSLVVYYLQDQKIKGFGEGGKKNEEERRIIGFYKTGALSVKKGLLSSSPILEQINHCHY